MSVRHDEWTELCALYALCALDAAESSRFETHLATPCHDCARVLAECAEGVSALAASAATPPAPALRTRILDAIAAEEGLAGGAKEEKAKRVERAAEESAYPPPLPPPTRIQRLDTERERSDRRIVRIPFVAALGWAAALAAALLGIVEQRTVRRLESETVALRQQQARLEDHLAEEQRWAATMSSPAARTAILAATTQDRAGLSGWALYDPSAQRAVVVLENLQLEPGHDFQLWAIGPHGPRSLGVIQVETGGRAFMRLTRVVVPADISAFAVSYEAKGGSPNPTAPVGPVVMAGTL